MIRVVKRSGRVEALDVSKIQKYTADAVKGLVRVSQSELEVDAKLQFRDMISSEEIQTTLIKTAVDKIDIDRPDWTFVAARLFLYDIYHKVTGFTGYNHLRDHFERGEKEGRIVLGLKEKYDLDELNDYLKPERDLQFNYLGIRTLYDRYLIKDRKGVPIELPQQLFMGVAMFLAQNEFDSQTWAKKFYDILSKFEVMAATPTLSNARTPRHQLSSCFTKGTQVRTIDGYKAIDKLALGDMVLTHKNRFMKVYELFERDYAKQLISLEVNGLVDKLEATEEHPVLSILKSDIKCIRKLGSCLQSQGKSKRCFSLKGEYKDDCELLSKKFSSKWSKIEDLNKGDFISVSYPKHIHKDSIYISDYVKTKNIITKDDKIMFKRSASSFYSCERSFLNNQIKPVNNKISLSKDFMRLVGYFLAEGHIAEDRSSITFTFGSKETLYIQETKSIIEKVFDVEAYVNIKKDNSTNVSVHSKIIGLFFDGLVGTGFDKKLLNNDLLFANPKVQEELLIGAIRGDGCALKEGYQLTMSNKKLIKQLFEVALRCGLSPFMKRDFRKHKWATVKASHLKIGVANDKDFLLKVNKNINKINLEGKASSTLRYFWFKDEYFMKIIERKESYLEDKVYNIEVEEDHSYSVAGVNVHNCYIGSTPDNIEGIFDGFKEMALLSKFGGGIGWDWSLVRGMGSYIDGHKHAAGGIVPFLKIANDVAIAVDQLGCVAKNSYVKVLDSVVTDNFEHDFRKEYSKADFTKKELREAIASYASSFAFKYANFSKNFISSLLFDYIMNHKGYRFLESVYGLNHDQYKKIIGRYKKFHKGLPEGFETILNHPNYAISKDGVVIKCDSLKVLSNTIDRKGYVRVALGKNALTLHLLLAKQYLEYHSDATIDHIDSNKRNNSLENLQLLSNEKNISKGWEETYMKRTEMSRIRRHLSYGHNLKGKRRDTHTFEINEIKTLLIPIDEVRIGDLILSYNIENNSTEYKAITAKHSIDVKQKDQIKIAFEDGNYIITSNWHPFPKLIEDKVTYVRSDSLQVGDITINEKNEFVKISKISKAKAKEDFMDLTVKDNNNYFCSTENKEGNLHLIHNTRKGAIAVYIEPWHVDIKDFLDLKKNSGEERRRAHDLFPAIWLNDLFMVRVEADATWTLFDPFEVKELTTLYGKEFEARYIELENSEDDITREVISAKGLWKEILRSYFETGNPFLTFKDTANRANPNKHAGVIRSTNLCVTGDTRLHTQFGLVQAKDLEENYARINASYDHRTDGDASALGVSIAPALKMFKTKEDAEIYQVTTKDGYTIKSTLWHEYYVSHGKTVEKKNLESIKVGDKLLIQSQEGQFGTEGNYDLGFLMGMVAGDGTFSYKEAKNHSIVHIDLYNQDMNLGYMIHKQIDDTITKYYPLLEKAHKQDFKNVYPKPIQHTKNSQKLRFSNIRLGRVFDELFDFNKEHKYQVPEIIFKGTKASVKGYLKGLFIADGTINILKNDTVPTFAIQLASIQKSLLEEVQILLSNFGIRSKITKMREAQENAFSYTTVHNEEKSYASKPLYRLNINGNNAIKYIDEIGFMGDKQSKALEVLSQREALGYTRHSRKSEKFEVEITEIKYIGKEDVYDTTQLHNHSLIFNGLVTGNCTEIFQNTSPNTYKTQFTFDDGSKEAYDENEMLTVGNGTTKPAKKVTALDTLDGKQIWMVDKEKTDGDTAVCNLASVNLSKIHTQEDLERVVPIAVRMLDNVIDLNFYPLAKVKKTNEKSRSIGLGVMGEAQMLAENKIEWGSSEHFSKIDEVMESFSYYTIEASSNLALEKGKYPTFEGSDWSKGIFPIDKANAEACKLVDRGGLFGYSHDWLGLKEKVKTDGMRNGYLMAIAPTSSISILTGTTQAIEPVYKRKWFEENLSGLIPVTAPNLSADTWQYYIPAYDLDQNILVKAGAIRQKWLDQGQSLNIFITLDKASGKYLNQIYMNAWKFGLKSTYYLRSQSPESSNDIEDRSQECVGCQ